eukprot:TRINITY_DN1706_c0_g1_i1.p2 TRINITY_DN1706_c0_g1~~TRINITY_DN1706_c0_g1_i1.p2  ORF type:complete len:134 (+),score=25.74 TRINITY_DN1706_c0_g1_i1:28-402(+)
MKALLKDGAPNTLRTDNGSEFISKEFQAVLKEKGIKHIFSRPHSPQENGMIERFNKTLKGLVYKYLTEWDLEKITNASLQKLVSNYNTKHTTTKQVPKVVHTGEAVAVKIARKEIKARAADLLK